MIDGLASLSKECDKGMMTQAYDKFHSNNNKQKHKTTRYIHNTTTRHKEKSPIEKGMKTQNKSERFLFIRRLRTKKKRKKDKNNKKKSYRFTLIVIM